MNVRITPRGHPERTELYGGVNPPVHVEAGMVVLRLPSRAVVLSLKDVAEIALDEDPGDYF